jgi:hypothetical protein
VPYVICPSCDKVGHAAPSRVGRRLIQADAVDRRRPAPALEAA